MMNSSLSFSDISAYPEKITTGTMLTRMADILGFRFYWATEGLTESDLKYSPGNENRNLYETLNHLYNMIDFVGTTLENKVYPFPEKENGFSLEELRNKTLSRIEEIKTLTSKSAEDTLDKKAVKITVGDTPMEFNIWHMMNPFLDAIFHTGQVVSFRRANGNPIDPCVQPFFGKRMEPK